MILFDDGKVPEAPQKKEEPKREIDLPGLVLECETLTRSVASGDEALYKVLVQNTSFTDGTFEVSTMVHYDAKDGEKIEWRVELFLDGVMKWENLHVNEHKLGNLEVKGNSKRIVEYKVVAPSGSRFGDNVVLIINVRNVDNPGIQQGLSLTTYSRQAFMAIKTQIGQERDVANSLANRALEKKVELAAILNPHPLRGYVIIESMKSDRLIDIIKSVKKARGIVEGEMPFEAVKDESGETKPGIEQYLTPKAIVSGMHEGDIVELVAGPFKGEKARVQSINEVKEEITVELFEAMVPIPVTVRGDNVRVIEKDKVNGND